MEEIKPRKPSGKILTLADVMEFCYDLPANDVEILNYLMNSESAKGISEIARELKISKAAVDRAILRLVELGLVKRTKDTTIKKGRPVYLHYVNREELTTRIMSDVEQCTKVMVEVAKRGL